MDILPWKIFILSTYGIAVIGCGIALGSLIDVQLSIRNATRRPGNGSSSVNSAQQRQINSEANDRTIKRGQRILRAITIFTVGIIIGSRYVFIYLFFFISFTLFYVLLYFCRVFWTFFLFFCFIYNSVEYLFISR